MPKWSRLGLALYLQQQWKRRRAVPALIGPGPLDRLVDTLDGLGSVSSPYTATNGFLVVRIVARNNAASVPNLTVKWGSTTLTEITKYATATVGTSIVAAYYAAITPGTQNLTITVANGSAGLAAIRVGELVTLTGIGMVENANQPSLTDQGYYVEVDGAEQASGNSIIGVAVGWQNDAAYGITASYPETEQWSTEQHNGAYSMTGYFAQSSTPTGENMGGANRMFVWYTGGPNASHYSPAAIAFELIGATLP